MATSETASAAEPLWAPGADAVAATRMAEFAAFAGRRHGRDLSDYQSLWRWSVDELEQFWADVWEFFGVRCSVGYEEVVSGMQMPGADWFKGARLNWAENVLAGRPAEKTAAFHLSELRPLRELTYGELSERVAQLAAALRAAGVEPGDRVVAYMPNIAETLMAALATTSLGAIWATAAPEFGARSVVDRFAQIEPKVVFAVDGYRYGGKDFDRGEDLRAILSELPTVERVVVLPYLDPEAGEIGLENAVAWDEFLASAPAEALRFEQVPPDHPLWVLFSSGTTGLPKAIVHSHGGILLEQLKSHNLHLDLRDGDRFFWFTTTGWMMWNLLVGSLLTEAAIVLYDGNPVHPGPEAMWRLAGEAKITCFGASASFFTSSQKSGLRPRAEYDLAALRAIGSTGSPLPPEGFDWIYAEVGSDLWLYSTSGGTDVCTPFVGGSPTLPVYSGELQCRQLGVSVEAWDEAGDPVVDAVGELVVTRPMPSMPVGLWNDEDGSRYRETYFEHFPGVWRHGDWVKITPRGGAVILGRSDATINRHGVRMGTAEIYRAVSSVPEVLDALVIDVRRPEADLWMPLFVVLRPGVELGDELIAEIKRRVRTDCSPRHVPDDVFQIPDTPKTLSGKVLELPVKRILSGADPEAVVSRGSIANPEALDWFVRFAAGLEVEA